jgi:hypothetical protein
MRIALFTKTFNLVVILTEAIQQVLTDAGMRQRAANLVVHQPKNAGWI